jgi:hypothetical protein
MPRAPKFCGATGCSAKVMTTYCPTHEAEAQARMDARRGTSRQRGYDGKHDWSAVNAKRAAVKAGALCPRCAQPMLAGQSLDYGHVTARVFDSSSRASRVEHAKCNRSAQHLTG